MDLELRLEHPVMLLNREGFSFASYSAVKLKKPMFLNDLLFIDKSSDVLQDMRVNVLEEGSDKVTWYKVINPRLIIPSYHHLN